MIALVALQRLTERGLRGKASDLSDEYIWQTIVDERTVKGRRKDIQLMQCFAFNDNTHY